MQFLLFAARANAFPGSGTARAGVFSHMQPEPATLFHLTPHERRILRMFVDGENYKSCALRLGVTVNTISYHVRHIYEKLQVHSRSEAVVKALRNGIIAEHTLTTAQRQ